MNFIQKLEHYAGQFEDLPNGDSWIGLPWGDERTDTAYAFQGIELFIEYVKREEEQANDER